MRKCGNCYNGHYNLSDRGEELYCNELEFIEERVEEDNCYEFHRYYQGMEEEKNYVFYDELYLAPGYFIMNIKDGKLNKFLKLYNTSSNGFPFFGIRGYSNELKENPNEEFSSVEFTFRDIEDDENGLYDYFLDLCDNLLGKTIFSIDGLRQGKSNFKLDSNSKVVKMILSKDIYNGIQPSNNYIDILIGDAYTCDNYYEMLKFYQSLSNDCINKTDDDEIKKLKRVIKSTNL